MGEPIRILLVDDSTFLRHSLTKRLETFHDIQVVGHAINGIDALEKVAELRPDVIVLDVEMPQMDGLTALQRIMEQRPTPVVMLSAHTQHGARTTIQALMWGAVDFVPKSETMGMKDMIEVLVAKIRVATCAIMPLPSLRKAVSIASAKPTKRPFQKGDPLILIGASTGGPRALQWVLSELPADLPAPIVVVQHMPAGFTRSLAQRLNDNSSLTVQEASDRQQLEHGLVLVAPGDHHIVFDQQRRVVLDRGPRRNHVRPAVDVSMDSAVDRYGGSVIGVILTGMGSDGTQGARAIKAAGGKVIAEHESTSVIYGMPRSVIEAGAVDRVVPLPQLAATLMRLVGYGR